MHQTTARSDPSSPVRPQPARPTRCMRPLTELNKRRTKTSPSKTRWKSACRASTKCRCMRRSVWISRGVAAHHLASRSGHHPGRRNPADAETGEIALRRVHPTVIVGVVDTAHQRCRQHCVAPDRHGLEPYLVASTVQAIVAQTTGAARSCEKCRMRITTRRRPAGVGCAGARSVKRPRRRRSMPGSGAISAITPASVVASVCIIIGQWTRPSVDCLRRNDQGGLNAPRAPQPGYRPLVQTTPWSFGARGVTTVGEANESDRVAGIEGVTRHGGRSNTRREVHAATRSTAICGVP